MMPRASTYLLYMIAIAWPLDVFQYVPIVGLSITAIATPVLLILTLLDLRHARKLRVPFEVLWPSAILCLLWAIVAQSDTGSTSFEIPAALALTISIIHLAPSQDTIEKLVRASTFSGAVCALLTVVGPISGVVPTAYSLSSTATYTFAYTMPGGTHILLLCFLASIILAGRKDQHPVVRTLLTIGSIPFLSVFIAKLTQIAFASELPTGRPYATFPTLTQVAILLTLWLLVRVAAKVSAGPKQGAFTLRTLFLLWAAATVLILALTPLQPRLYHGFLLGLMCAYALPERPQQYEISWPKTATVFILFLFAFNVGYVSPGHAQDPRNYESAALREFDTGNFATILKRLDHIEKYAPEELRTHLWRARVALAQDNPNAASMEFVRSLEEPERRQILPKISEAEVDYFIVQLRDQISLLSEREVTCAYERALLAIGERDQALFSLQLGTGISLAHSEVLSIQMLASAVAAIVGDPLLEEELQSWTSDALLTLLTQWGADVSPPPEDFPRDMLPAIFVAQRRLDSIDVLALFGDQRRNFNMPIGPRAASPRQPDTENSSMRWTLFDRIESTNWQTHLSATDDDSGVGLYLELSDNRSVSLERDRDDLSEIPFTPAIRIYAN